MKILNFINNNRAYYSGVFIATLMRLLFLCAIWHFLGFTSPVRRENALITCYYTPVIKASPVRVKGSESFYVPGMEDVYVPYKYKIDKLIKKEGFVCIEVDNKRIYIRETRGKRFIEPCPLGTSRRVLKQFTSFAANPKLKNRKIRVGNIEGRIDDTGDAFQSEQLHFDQYVGQMTPEKFNKDYNFSYKTVVFIK